MDQRSRKFLKIDKRKVIFTFFLTYLFIGYLEWISLVPSGGLFIQHLPLSSRFRPETLVLFAPLIILAVPVFYLFSCIVVWIFPKLSITSLILSLLLIMGFIALMDVRFNRPRGRSLVWENTLCQAFKRLYCEAMASCNFSESCRPGNRSFLEFVSWEGGKNAPNCKEIAELFNWSWNVTPEECRKLLS